MKKFVRAPLILSTEPFEVGVEQFGSPGPAGGGPATAAGGPASGGPGGSGPGGGGGPGGGQGAPEGALGAAAPVGPMAREGGSSDVPATDSGSDGGDGDSGTPATAAILKAMAGAGAPMITVQPVDVTVTRNNSATGSQNAVFTVAATGPGTLRYQWEFAYDGLPATRYWTPMLSGISGVSDNSGFNTDTLTLFNIPNSPGQIASAGNYQGGSLAPHHRGNSMRSF